MAAYCSRSSLNSRGISLDGFFSDSCRDKISFESQVDPSTSEWVRFRGSIAFSMLDSKNRRGRVYKNSIFETLSALMMDVVCGLLCMGSDFICDSVNVMRGTTKACLDIFYE